MRTVFLSAFAFLASCLLCVVMLAIPNLYQAEDAMASCAGPANTDQARQIVTINPRDIPMVVSCVYNQTPGKWIVDQQGLRSLDEQRGLSQFSDDPWVFAHPTRTEARLPARQIFDVDETYRWSQIRTIVPDFVQVYPSTALIGEGGLVFFFALFCLYTAGFFTGEKGHYMALSSAVIAGLLLGAMFMVAPITRDVRATFLSTLAKQPHPTQIATQVATCVNHQPASRLDHDTSVLTNTDGQTLADCLTQAGLHAQYQVTPDPLPGILTVNHGSTWVLAKPDETN